MSKILVLVVLVGLAASAAVEKNLADPAVTLLFEAPHRSQIHLRNKIIDVEVSKPVKTTTESVFLESETKTWTSKQTTSLGQYVVHMKTPITAPAKDAVNAAIKPYNLGAYIPHNSFLVVGPHTSSASGADFLTRLQAAPSVLHAMEYTSDLKVEPTISKLIEQRQRGQLEAFAKPDHLRMFITPEMAGSHAAVEALASQWQTMMAEEGITGVQLKVVSDRFMDVQSHGSKLHDATSWLSQRNEVHWIEKVQQMKLQNRNAKYVIQGNTFDQTRIWSQGLHGEGQIVGLGDTGIDADQCFFDDPAQPVPYGQPNFSHRKIVYYVALGDKKDDSGGHGTHVAGSIVGEIPTSPDDDTRRYLRDYNGMAPRARLAFIDLKKNGEEDLLVPGSIYDDYYTDLFNNGKASFSSNSWGSTDGSYNSYNQDTDRFAWDHRDFLPIYAAGNYGERGFYSISSPGSSKNALTIGACHNMGFGTGIRVTSPSNCSGDYSLTPAGFGKEFDSMSFDNLLLVRADPEDACDDLNGDIYTDKAVLVKRGNCPFSEKARRVDLKGGKLMLVWQDTAGQAPSMGRSEQETWPIYCAAAAMDFITYNAMVGACPGEQVRLKGPIKSNVGQENMASFSSRGPTPDGRLKPDVVAPGQYVISARSDGNPDSHNCAITDTLPMQGTSMATPVAAGGAALVRQYYTEGFYPTGQRVAANQRVPSAALIKATIIASATSVGGYVDTQDDETGKMIGVAVAPAPSIFQGYGRMQLDNSLSFATGGSGVKLWMVDNQAITDLQLKSYCFRVQPRSAYRMYPAFRATLVWTDPAATISTSFALVNNLDLFAVNVATKEVLVGNQGLLDQDGEATPWDYQNNVEQVTVPFVVGQPLTYSVHVRATHVPSGGQTYALVVTGDIEAQLDMSACGSTIVCPNNCGGPSKGTCGADGQCQCVKDLTGSDCGVTSTAMTGDPKDIRWFSATGKVASGGWKHFHFDTTSEHQQSGFSIIMRRTSTRGDPDVYVDVDVFPTLLSELKSTNCDSCSNHKDSVITVQPSDVRIGRYRVGIQGYCCDDSEFALSVTYPVQPVTNPDTPKFTTVLIAAGVVLAIIGLLFLYRHIKHRNLSSRQGGYTIAGGPVNAGARGYSQLGHPDGSVPGQRVPMEAVDDSAST